MHLFPMQFETGRCAPRIFRRLPRAASIVLLAFGAACAGGADVTGTGGGNTGGNTGGNGGPPASVPSRIDLSASTIGLGAVGASENVTALVRDASGNALPAAAVSWSSADITIADVSGNGATATITARAPGRTSVRATSGQVTQELTVTVTVVRAITLPATSQVRSGASLVLSPVLDADPGAATALRWDSADPTIATVSGGVVTGVQPGATVIRVSAVGDPRVTASTQLTVSPARSIAIRNAPEEMGLGDELQLTATVDVNSGESTGVEWSTSNPTVASITSGGRLIAVGLGTVVVRAQSSAFVGVRDSAVVAVRIPRRVTVAPATLSIGPGQTQQLAATVQIESGLSTAVTWRSADPSVAIVAANGLLTGVAQGTTTITAVSVADTTRRGNATVTVVPMVRTVDVQPSTATIVLGGTRQLTATVTADPGASTAVSWRSSNPAVAQVAANGTVTAIAQGTATVTAIAAGDSTRRSSATITVVPVVRDLEVQPATASIAVGQTRQLAASVAAEPGTDVSVTWRSSNAAVATVSSSGLVTGVASGAAIISAVSVADTTRQSTALITVTNAATVQSIDVSPRNVALQAGQTAQLVPQVQVSGGASTGVTYRSDNPAVASVNFAGLVTALSGGSATITVTAVADPGKTAAATVTVSTAPTQLASSWSSTRLGGALHEDVVSLDAVDGSNAFAVNSVGDVFRFVGGSWTLGTRGSAHGTQFLAVSATSSSSAVAVGTNGVIVRFNGSSWSRASSGTQQTLHGVHLETGSSGFAVGAGGVVLRLSGSTWTSQPSGTSQTLYGVWSAGNTGFAVGTGGTVLRWNGSTWSEMSSGTTETLYGVDGLSANSAVAVGTFGTVLRWNGSAWSRVSNLSVTADLYNVAGNGGDSRYYIASDDGLYQLNGTALSLVSTPYAPRLFGAAVDAVYNVWTSGQRGSVMRRTNGSWNTVSLAPDLIDVWTTGSNNAWAVGEFGFVYQWNGSAWTRQTTPTTATLNTVWGTSATDAFAAGDNGTMLRWNGSSWTSMVFPSTGSVYGLWGTASNNVYAVTSSGDVLRFNGTGWTTVTTTASALWVVFGSAANDVYVAGENGAALRFNGTGWSTLSAPTSGTLAGLWASGTGNVMAVGSGSTGLTGVAFRFGGSSWSSLSLPGTAVLTSVWGPSANDVYATGESGMMLRWNGSAWSAMSTGTSDLLWAVSGAPNGSGGAFAVGYNSTVVAGNASGLVMAGLRSGGTVRSPTLDPRAGAKLVRGALPAGAARRHRR